MIILYKIFIRNHLASLEVTGFSKTGQREFGGDEYCTTSLNKKETYLAANLETAVNIVKKQKSKLAKK